MARCLSRCRLSDVACRSDCRHLPVLGSDTHEACVKNSSRGNSGGRRSHRVLPRRAPLRTVPVPRFGGSGQRDAQARTWSGGAHRRDPEPVDAAVLRRPTLDHHAPSRVRHRGRPDRSSGRGRRRWHRRRCTIAHPRSRRCRSPTGTAVRLATCRGAGSRARYRARSPHPGGARRNGCVQRRSRARSRLDSAPTRCTSRSVVVGAEPGRPGPDRPRSRPSGDASPRGSHRERHRGASEPGSAEPDLGRSSAAARSRVALAGLVRRVDGTDDDHVTAESAACRPCAVCPVRTSSAGRQDRCFEFRRSRGSGCRRGRSGGHRSHRIGSASGVARSAP